jgi:hypothetical protein
MIPEIGKVNLGAAGPEGDSIRGFRKMRKWRLLRLAESKLGKTKRPG